MNFLRRFNKLTAMLVFILIALVSITGVYIKGKIFPSQDVAGEATIATPEPTFATSSPVPSPTPEQTPSAAPKKAPVKTATPKPSATSEPTATPTSEPTASPTPEPTATTSPEPQPSTASPSATL